MVRIDYPPRVSTATVDFLPKGGIVPATVDNQQEFVVLVTVDWDLCEGHGLCALTAPDVFSFDELGRLQVVDRPAPEHRAAVGESARMCPALAVRITDGQ
jgi:ferredoxin